MQIPDYRNAVIVAKNPLAARRATSYAERLRLGIAVIHGEVKEGDEDEEDGRASPPPSFANRVTTVGATLPPLTAKEKPPINVVGDVGGKIAIMVDDMIDDVKSFVDAACVLKVRYRKRLKLNKLDKGIPNNARKSRKSRKYRNLKKA